MSVFSVASTFLCRLSGLSISGELYEQMTAARHNFFETSYGDNLTVQLLVKSLKMKIMKSSRNKPPSAAQDTRASGSKDDTRNDRIRNDALNRREDSEEKKLPGEYPPGEDIMNRMNTTRVGMDVENFSRRLGADNLEKEDRINRQEDREDEGDSSGPDVEDRHDRFPMEHPVPRGLSEEDTDIEATSESDVTEEDLQALGPKDLSMDMGEDEQLLKNRVWPVDMAGEDLDVPGSEGAGRVEDQGIGPADEENDFYSLGGDRHEDNMEGK